MNLLIAGAGGHGRVLADAALATGSYTSVAFLDDRKLDSTVEGWPIIGSLDSLERLRSTYEAFVVGFGDAQLRLELLSRAKKLGFVCTPIVHPGAMVSSYCSIGEGSVVIGGACVNVGVRIGVGCIINTGATVDHDCILSDGVHICPGAHLSGGIRVGVRTWFGVGAVARQGVSIGMDVMVGAGAVIVADVPDGVTVVGNPARVLKP